MAANPKRRAAKTTTRVGLSTRKIAATARQDAERFRLDQEPGGALGALTGAEPTPSERARMVRLSRLNHKRSGVYGQIVDCLVDFIVGDGPEITCEDPDLGRLVRAIFDDPANAWHRTYRQRVAALIVDGEYLLSAVVPYRGLDETGAKLPSASVLFGRMDIECIEGVETSALNMDRVSAVLVKGSAGGDAERYPIARPGVTMRQDEAGFVAVFLWRVNTLGRRGVPLLSRSLDKATLLDAVVSELARKAEYVNRFWLHGTYPSSNDDTKDAKTEEKILAWLESIEPGAAAATTDGVKVDVKSPNLGAMDARELVEVVLEYVLGSHGIPRMWYSAGGDTNRATAVEQGTPIHRRIDAVQSIAKMDLEDVVRFVISILKWAGAWRGTNESFSVTMADVATRDSMRDVSEIGQLVAALDAAVASDIIAPEERQGIGRTVLRGKSYGDQLDEKLKPKIAPKVSLAPPPPGSMPGFPGSPALPPAPTRPEPPKAPEAGKGPAAATPGGS